VDHEDVLRQFDREIRRQPSPIPGVTFDRVDGVVRGHGIENFVLCCDLEGREARAVIADQLRFYAAQGAGFEWKVYSYDRPPDFPDRLREAGFVSDPEETLLVFDLLGRLPDAPLDVEVRRVTDPGGFRELMSVTAAAFGPDHAEGAERLSARLRDPTVAFFVAYVDGVAAAGGRLEMPEGTAFAGIWGGGTIPSLRHRGVYRALTSARAEVARARGFRYLMVEAAPTSRPILERLGFEALATVRGWRSPS
jgi:GNAT superfamily N-acetyltransferase